MNNLIYLDNAATTFPKPEVVYHELDRVFREMGVNSGRSSYTLARKANNLIEETKQNLLNLVDTKSGQVVLTPSATIALNQIIGGLDIKSKDVVYVSPFEHNAVMRPLHYYSKQKGFKIKVLPYDRQFILDVEEMKYMFTRERPNYLFLSHISNVTGYILDIEAIARQGKQYGATTIIDASQSIGLLPINLEKQNIDFMVFTGHKNLYGPFGIGGYIKNCQIKLKPVLLGGTGSDSLNLDLPEDNYEVGSPNISAIAGLNAAIKWINNEKIEKIRRKKKILTEMLIKEMKDIYELTLFIPKESNEHIGIISFVHRDYSSDELGEILDQEFNISVRTGYHCAPLIHDLLKTHDTRGTVRCSIGYFNTEEDITNFALSLKEI